MSDIRRRRFRSGLIFGLIAYLWWGLVPLYFAALASDRNVPAWEILAHRITWSLPIMLVLTAAIGRVGRPVPRPPQSAGSFCTLLLSSLLLAINWLLYIYATVTNRVTEASLGYYMMPLVNAALATIFLKEKLRPAHYPALALVAIGVAIPFVAAGTSPGSRSRCRSRSASTGWCGRWRRSRATTGLTVETLLMLAAVAGVPGVLCGDRTEPHRRRTGA